MKVTEENVNSLFCNRVQYKIPLFQRHYVWDKEDQWKPLWNDIKNRLFQQGIHFTGTLVIQKETLVTRQLNSKLGNRTFSKKKEALTQHSSLKLNNEICQHDTWDVNAIHVRAESLINDVCKIWPSLDWFAENLP